jgi:hypothetical protein
MQYPSAESSWAAWNTADLLFPGSSTKNWAPLITASLTDGAAKSAFGSGTTMTLTCTVPAHGVCFERATVVYSTAPFGLFPKTKIVKYVGRDDTGSGRITHTFTLEPFSSVMQAQADLTATGIAGGNAEQTGALSVNIR